MEDIIIYGAVSGVLTVKDNLMVWENHGNTSVIPFDQILRLDVKPPRGHLPTGIIKIKLVGAASGHVRLGAGVSVALNNDIEFAPSSRCRDECIALQERFLSWKSSPPPAPPSPTPAPSTDAASFSARTCPECGHAISIHAPACVGCGCPMDIIQKIWAEKENAEAAAEKAARDEDAARAADALRIVSPIIQEDGRVSCPKCGKTQKADRHLCSSCSAPFDERGAEFVSYLFARDAGQ